jgi:uncharacterized membrane protein
MTNLNDSKITHDPIDHYEGYWMIFVLLFAMFIVIAFIGQMFFIDWRIWLPGAEKSMSMYEGVSASVHTVISQVI